MYSGNVQRWLVPFLSIPVFSLALDGGAYAWGGVLGAARQVLVMLKASSEAIILSGGKAKLADVRSNREERFTLAARPPLYCRRLIPGNAPAFPSAPPPPSPVD